MRCYLLRLSLSVDWRSEWKFLHSIRPNHKYLESSGGVNCGSFYGFTKNLKDTMLAINCRNKNFCINKFVIKMFGFEYAFRWRFHPLWMDLAFGMETRSAILDLSAPSTMPDTTPTRLKEQNSLLDFRLGNQNCKQTVAFVMIGISL
jgi:hypothetical protein